MRSLSLYFGIAFFVAFGIRAHCLAGGQYPTVDYQGIKDTNSKGCLFNKGDGSLYVNVSPLTSRSILVDFRTRNSSEGFFHFAPSKGSNKVECSILASAKSDRPFKVLIAGAALPIVKYGDKRAQFYGEAFAVDRSTSKVSSVLKGNTVADATMPTSTFINTPNNLFTHCSKEHAFELGFSLFADPGHNDAGLVALNAPMYTVYFDYKACAGSDIQ